MLAKVLDHGGGIWREEAALPRSLPRPRRWRIDGFGREGHGVKLGIGVEGKAAPGGDLSPADEPPTVGSEWRPAWPGSPKRAGLKPGGRSSRGMAARSSR